MEGDWRRGESDEERDTNSNSEIRIRVQGLGLGLGFQRDPRIPVKFHVRGYFQKWASNSI